MKNLFLFFWSLVCITTVMLGCQREHILDETESDQKNILTKAKSHKNGQPIVQGVLVKGLAGSLGSTIGPSGDLFVPDPVAGAILRIDPETGEYITYASGLPKMITEVGVGGITDVAFLGGKAYALVTLVDDPNLFPTGQINGIYRIDGPNSYTIIADIGAYNVSNPPTGFNFDVSSGVLYAIQAYRGGFLVTDGHLNRLLYISLDGEITIVQNFNNIVPTGLDVKGNQIYMTQAGPVPHLPENGKVLVFNTKSLSVTNVASGAPLLVDVEFGRGQTLFALSQGDYSGNPEGSPALPNTGSLLRVNADGTFTTIADGLNLPTSLEIIGDTAYIITLTGEIWTIDNISNPPHGRSQHKHLIQLHG